MGPRIAGRVAEAAAVKIVILCGGQGTRLREETEYRPKPLVEIGGRPIVWHIMRHFAHYGYREFVLCLGYKGGMIKNYFLNYPAVTGDVTVHTGTNQRIEYHAGRDEPEFSVTLADTGAETMTGGRVARVAKYLTGDEFVVTYGDGVSNVDLTELVRFHRSHGKTATVTTTRPTSRYGVLELEHDGTVSRFREKPRLDGWASCGYFVFRRSFVEELHGDDCVLEGSPLERLAERGELVAYRHDGFFYAMDTYREFVQLNEWWDSGRAPWKVWP